MAAPSGSNLDQSENTLNHGSSELAAANVAAAALAAQLTNPSSTSINNNSSPSPNPNPNLNSNQSSSTDHANAVLTYLTKRGFSRAEAALRAEIEALSNGATPAQAQAAALQHSGPQSVSLKDLAIRNAPRNPNAKEKAKENTTGGEEGDKEIDHDVAAAEALSKDPSDRARGFKMLVNWCEGSLDIYQPELTPLLLPIFVNFYLDLLDAGLIVASQAFFTAFSYLFYPSFSSLLSHLRSLTLGSQARSDALAQRFRTERYILKITQTVFTLLIGWLTDGTGPVAGAGANESLIGEGGLGESRGREMVVKAINERCRIQVLQTKPYELNPLILEEGTGLTGALSSDKPNQPSYSIFSRSSLAPGLSQYAVSTSDALSDFNARAAGPQLKLAPVFPMNDRLKKEVERELGEEEKKEKEKKEKKEKEAREKKEKAEKELQQLNGDAMEGVESTEGGAGTTTKEASSSSRKPSSTPATKGRDGTANATNSGRTPSAAPGITSISSGSGGGPNTDGLLAPTHDDLPPQPYPSSFRTVDLQREVARVKDARRALRFNLTSNNSGGTINSAGNGGFLSGVRDASFNSMGEEGAKFARNAALPSVCMYTYHDADDGLTSSTFSQDSTLMAAGFEESYVQVWSLKGESLNGLRSDFDLAEVRDAKSLKRQRTQHALSTRKLIGHSGPVYSVDFDPVAGSSRPPRHLLSSSADGTARLWSLDTYSALVSYRGHQHPVWDVKWGPTGTYFATASADKTARLWTTERINPLRIYAGHLSDVDCLSFHPNSLYLATGSSDRTCRLWDVQRGAAVRLFTGHTSAISSVKISPDGRYLASAGSSSSSYGFGASPSSGVGGPGDASSISLWDLASGRRIKKMWGHSGSVHSMDFSSDGNLLITGSSDCTVRVWDVKGSGGERRSSPLGSLEAQQIEQANKANAGNNPGGKESQIKSRLPPSTDVGKGLMPLSRNHGKKTSNEVIPSLDCIAAFHTKKTPVVDVQFTPRNLCLVSGAYQPSI